MKIIALIISLASLSAWSGTTMNLEGKCSGTLRDGSSVSFTYYSNFNGCTSKATAALTYTKGMEGLLTGTRSFTDEKDYYLFPQTSVTFANSTGNTSGTFKYFDGRYTKSVKVQCDVRDYEYSDC